MRELKVAIVGCGSGGPATAALLAMDGHEVTLFEEAAKLDPVGAGILLQPTGMDVLDQIGVLDEVLAHGAPIHRLTGKTVSGRTVLDIPYSDVDEDVMGLGMYRATLLAILAEAMQERGAELLLDTGVAKLVREGSRHRLIDTRGVEHGPFDLVVLADGARSRMRAQLGLERTAEEYPWGALFFIGKEVGPPASVLAQTFEGSGTFLGLLPTGRAYQDDQRLISLFWSVRNDRVTQWRERGVDYLKERMLDMMPSAEPLVSQVQSFDDFVHARYFDIVLDRMFVTGIACIGDHAHAMSPQLGQGVNMALLDAIALADAIEDNRHMTAALAQFDHRRRAHLEFYQPVNRIATPFFQSNSLLLGMVRDYLMPVVSMVPFLRRQQALTMAGLKQGPFHSRAVSPEVQDAIARRLDDGE